MTSTTTTTELRHTVIATAASLEGSVEASLRDWILGRWTVPQLRAAFDVTGRTRADVVDAVVAIVVSVVDASTDWWNADTVDADTVAAITGRMSR